MTTPDLDLLINAFVRGEMQSFAGEQPEFYRNADSSAQLAYLMFGSSGPNCTQGNYEGHMFLYSKASMRDLLETVGFSPGQIAFHYVANAAPIVGPVENSASPVFRAEALDAGMSHSFAVEAIG